MKLTAINVRGMRGMHERVELATVTLFTGPNGTGKTTALGAVMYALTGRFPAFKGAKAPDLIGLATNPQDGFQVILEASDPSPSEAVADRVRVVRGITVGDGGPAPWLEVTAAGQTSRRVTDANTALARLFGNVEWFADAFDAERSVWQLSTEKRKEWATSVCAGVSGGWTPERLIAEVGSETDDWQPHLRSDPGATVDANLRNVSASLLSVQRLVRDANTIADGVTVGESEEAIERRLKAAESAHEAARTTANELQVKVRAAGDTQAAIETARRESVRLTKSILEVKWKLDAQIVPPSPPEAFDEAHLSDLRAQEFAATLAWEDAKAGLESATSEYAAAEQAVAIAKRDADYIVEHKECSLCGTASPGQERVAKRLMEASQRLVQAESDRNRCRTNERAASTALDAAINAVTAALTERQQRLDARQCAISDRSRYDEVRGLLNANLAELEAQRVKLPADRPDVLLVDLNTALMQARTVESQRQIELNRIRAEMGVARERAGQLKSSQEAQERVKVLKRLRDRIRAVRDRMLTDSVRPLDEALAQVSDLAPRHGRWGIHLVDDSLDVALFDGQSVLPVTSLSAGERMRGTLALMVARAMVRREPWVGLFVDNFEQIHPESERIAVLRALVATCNAHFVDNVIVAAACDRMDVPGVLTQECSRMDAARTGT